VVVVGDVEGMEDAGGDDDEHGTRQRRKGKHFHFHSYHNTGEMTKQACASHARFNTR